MNDKYFYQKIELLNQEKQVIKNSKEYKLGFRVIAILNSLKKFKFSALIKSINDKYASAKLAKINRPRTSIVNYNKSEEMAKIAVYTCVIGEYDNIAVPLLEFPNVDYYLLTDNSKKYEVYKNIFRIIQLPEKILNKGAIIANRYTKFHPKDFFAKYDYAIYMDGNVRIISDIRKFTCKCNTSTGIAMHRHRERDCIYDEITACKLYKRGNLSMLEKQIQGYKVEKFPRHFGMNEATIIVSDLNNPKSFSLLNQWWEEFIKSGSFRDQIAWPYVLWKNGYTLDDIGNLGNNIYNNYIIEMQRHN